MFAAYLQAYVAGKRGRKTACQILMAQDARPESFRLAALRAAPRPWPHPKSNLTTIALLPPDVGADIATGGPRAAADPVRAPAPVKSRVRRTPKFSLSGNAAAFF